MTMLEKAARAACGYFDMDPDKMLHVAPGQAHEPAWKQVVPLIRAVLMAVMEPPSEVVEAGMIAGGFNGMADLAFTAMIDAILNEDQP